MSPLLPFHQSTRAQTQSNQIEFQPGSWRALSMCPNLIFTRAASLFFPNSRPGETPSRSDRFVCCHFGSPQKLFLFMIVDGAYGVRARSNRYLLKSHKYPFGKFREAGTRGVRSNLKVFHLLVQAGGGWVTPQQDPGDKTYTLSALFRSIWHFSVEVFRNLRTIMGSTLSSRSPK